MSELQAVQTRNGYRASKAARDMQTVASPHAMTFPTDLEFKDRAGVRGLPDSEGRQHQPMFIPANDRFRASMYTGTERRTVRSLKPRVYRGTVPAYL